MLHIHARERLLLLFGALALAVAFTLTGVAAPASAHDSVLSTTPSDAEHLDTAPETVSMRFTDDIMQLGAVMLVVDGSKTDWAKGLPTLDGPTATLALDPDLPDGAYQARWRVVSADGHPISGTFDFTVGDVSAAPAPTANAGAPADPGKATSNEAPEADAGGRSAGSDTGVPLGITALIGAISGLALFLGIYALGRRRRASVLKNNSTSTEKTQP